MPGHTFPGRHGSNPFSDAHEPPKAGTETLPTRPINQVVEEEEEGDAVASPTTGTFPSSKTSPDPFGSNGTSDGAPSSFKPSSDGFPSNYGMGRRTSVSAESMNPTDSASDKWTPPFYPKTEEQLKRLKSAIGAHTLFRALDDEQSRMIIGALVEKPIPARNIKVISQGDQGDYFYIVESGSFDIYIHPSGSLQPGPSGLGTKVATITVGGTFGELALMYGAPRNATVISATNDCVLWALDRVTFRRILMDYTFTRRRMYEKFLAEVPLLSSLNDYERSKIADALESCKYSAGSTIIKEGDDGEAFYLLEDGQASAYKTGVEKPVKNYRKGDYFGELALLNKAPRAASVVCDTDVKVATLGKDGFQRLLGPVEGIMRRERYEGVEGVERVDPLVT
ncbi:hypothetical protein VC83_06220 [Pseudogymnoascus destructans]|uniref:cAMP-dependent protein kinase regulatory subunit n=2 Tax=Pseudogymnoascus destructans TaxID=655981 RepID=L8G9D5_PSED2|nr:uncharacterized protein VC83_06220 [Pseudogymnoascus destructans]ELR09672.1 hypothetical protein GMDG_04158 [Pseudogymnoascus destructans 20631-21]OAF58808.1 hypothetical protein VC83_06220 [Pseudogymnoascus destructans]